MKNIALIIPTLIVFMVHFTLLAQEDEFFDENYLRYENHVYDPNIKTVQLFRQGWNEAHPVIQLSDRESRLHLTFDDLQDNLRNLGFTFVHCDAQWEPSDLLTIEYLNGMKNHTIENYGFSSTLYQRFVKYDLTFPNENVEFTKSGNYLLVVFDMDNNNQPVLTRRFFVVENFVAIIPNIHRPTQAIYRQNSHEVDFTINQGEIEIVQPFSTMKVVVIQNQDWSSAITDLKPRFINGRSLSYDYDEENVFPGGNQFRVVDIRNINYNSMTTKEIATINDTMHAYLFTEKPRSSMAFSTVPDINGHYYLKNDDVRFDSDLESEYMKVHFSLEYPAKLYKADIYIYGQLSGWEIDEDYKMEWNTATKRYEASLYLKQGYYNYLYMYKSENSQKGDVSVIEGSHVEADNEYSFFVYYREPSQVYDRLIGFHTALFPNYKNER
jgi:hypothetical protein